MPWKSALKMQIQQTEDRNRQPLLKSCALCLGIARSIPVGILPFLCLLALLVLFLVPVSFGALFSAHTRVLNVRTVCFFVLSHIGPCGAVLLM